MNIAICDDNINEYMYAVDIIKSNFEKYFSFREISFETFSSPKKMLVNHKEMPFDVIFLDIEMPEMDGFSVSENVKMCARDTLVIFFTTHNEMMLDSFDFQPFSFIKKDTTSVFEQRVSHVVQRIAHHMKQNEFVVLDMRYKESVRIMINKVVYISSDKNYIDYHIADETLDTPRVRGKLNDVEQKYDEYDFARTHVRYLVNMRHIKKLDYPNDRILMDNDKILPLARKLRISFDEKYTEYIMRSK